MLIFSEILPLFSEYILGLHTFCYTRKRVMILYPRGASWFSVPLQPVNYIPKYGVPDSVFLALVHTIFLHLSWCRHMSRCLAQESKYVENFKLFSLMLKLWMNVQVRLGVWYRVFLINYVKCNTLWFLFVFVCLIWLSFLHKYYFRITLAWQSKQLINH